MMTCYDLNLWFNDLIKAKKNSLWTLRSNNLFYTAKKIDYLFIHDRKTVWNEKKFNPEKFITIFISIKEKSLIRKSAMKFISTWDGKEPSFPGDLHFHSLFFDILL